MATDTPKISNYEMAAMTGEIPPWRHQMLAKARPGVNGYTFVQLGQRSKPFELRTRKTESTFAWAKRTAEQFEALCSTFVRVREPGGREHMRILVLDVVTKIRPLAVSTDGKSYVVEATWSMQRGGTS